MQKPTVAGEPQSATYNLVWVLFVDPFERESVGSGLLYEDEGNSLDYKKGAGAQTQLQFRRSNYSKFTITISPTEGTFDGQAALREHKLQIRPSVRLSICLLTLQVPQLTSPALL